MRRLAIPFVVTLALPACDRGFRTSNPPEPTTSSPPVSDAGTATTASAKPSVGPPAPPAARNPAHVSKRADGKCYYEPPMDCPPNRHCNPPEPEVVPCPEK